VTQTKAVGQAVRDKDFDKAMELRGAEFGEALDGFHATSSLYSESAKLPQEQVSGSMAPLK
jgi:6-phosphofructokinase 1